MVATIFVDLEEFLMFIEAVEIEGQSLKTHQSTQHAKPLSYIVHQPC